MADTNSRLADVVAATDTDPKTGTDAAGSEAEPRTAPKEVGGRDGPEPTRFGDWEKAGRCIDF